MLFSLLCAQAAKKFKFFNLLLLKFLQFVFLAVEYSLLVFKVFLKLLVLVLLACQFFLTLV